jgi:hypothetical protein
MKMGMNLLSVVCRPQVHKIFTPHPLTSRRVCTPPPPPLVRGGGHTRWVERGVGGSIYGKTPDTALYSTYVSTLWVEGNKYSEVYFVVFSNFNQIKFAAGSQQDFSVTFIKL